MANPNIIGTPNDVIWGSNGVYGSGRIISGRRHRSVEKDLSLDNNGVPTGAVTIAALIENEFEMECQANVALPNLDDAVTVCGDANCYIEDIEELWERKGRKRARVKVYKFPA